MQMPIHTTTQTIRALRLPIKDESFEIVNAPGTAINCINNIAMMRFVSGIDNSPFPYNDAESITVCTPILKKKNEDRYLFNNGKLPKCFHTFCNSLYPLESK